MAVQLSHYQWFRNNYLDDIVNPRDKFVEQHHFRGKKLSPEDKRILCSLVEELDELKSESHFKQGTPRLNERVALANVVELKDVTSDKELAAKCFEGIYKVMERNNVNCEWYRQLGRCFEEIRIKPPVEIAEAIQCAYMRVHSVREGWNEHIDLAWAKDYSKRSGKSLREVLHV